MSKILAGLAGILMFGNSALAQPDIAANPTRPSASDNAYLVARGYTEIELGLAFDDRDWTLPALLKFAVHRNLELGFSMSGIITNSEGSTDIGTPGVQAKYQLADQYWGALSVAGRVDFPESADPSYTLYGVSSLLFSFAQVDATVGGSRLDVGNGSYDTLFSYALAVSPKVSGRLGTYVEIFGQHINGSHDMAADAGLSYTHSPRFVTDVSVVLGLTSDMPDWTIQAGFTTTLIRLF